MRISANELAKANNFDLLHAALNCLETYHSRGNKVPDEIFKYIQDEITGIIQLKEKAYRIMRRTEEKDIIDEMYGPDRLEEE